MMPRAVKRQINPQFWKGRRVLLTGHTGFKGSWLSIWLQMLGAETYGYSLPAPTSPNLYELAGVARGMGSSRGDVRDGERLHRVLDKTSPDVVIHLAAQSVVRVSYENPVETYSTNIMGTVNTLEALRQSSRKCVAVVVTSDKCYADQPLDRGYNESDPLGGCDPYSSSKACAELITSAFRESFFNVLTDSKVAVATARAGNVIGGGDWTRDQLVPDTIRAFIDHKPVCIRKPAAVRPWQFVLEPLHGYLLLAERLWEDPLVFSDCWNFGPNEEDVQTVSHIVERLVSLWGDGAAWAKDSRPHPHEAQILRLDTAKTRSKLRWAPSIHLDEALQWTVDWYKAYTTGKDMRETTRRQISKYMECTHGAATLPRRT